MAKKRQSSHSTCDTSEPYILVPFSRMLPAVQSEKLDQFLKENRVRKRLLEVEERAEIHLRNESGNNVGKHAMNDCQEGNMNGFCDAPSAPILAVEHTKSKLTRCAEDQVEEKKRRVGPIFENKKQEYRLEELAALNVEGFNIEKNELETIRNRIQGCIRRYFAVEMVFKNDIEIKHGNGSSVIPSSSIWFCHSKSRFDAVCESAVSKNRIELESYDGLIEPTFELYEKRFVCKLVDEEMVFGKAYKILILNSTEGHDVVLMSTDDIMSLAVEYLAFYSSVSKISQTIFMNVYMKWIHATCLGTITQFGSTWATGSRNVSVDDGQFKEGLRPLELVSINHVEEHACNEDIQLFRQNARKSQRVPAIARVFRHSYFSIMVLAEELRRALGLEKQR